MKTKKDQFCDECGSLQISNICTVGHEKPQHTPTQGGHVMKTKKHSKDCMETNSQCKEQICICDSKCPTNEEKKMSVANHTPTPWRVGKGHRIEYGTPGGGCVVVVDEHSINGLGMDAFIAHAANAHEEMLIALKQLAVRFPLEFKTTTHPPKCTCNQFTDNDFCRHLDALAAIDKAEGGK